MVRFALVATLVLGVTAPVMAQNLHSVELPALMLRVPAPSVDAPARPRMLIPLYVSFGVLQVMDAHSTARALQGGAVESNPLMKEFAGNSASMLAVKAGGTAVAIFAAERLWPRNRAAAVGFMIAANAGISWVVQHNYRAVR
jgi:hypothetical protein